MSEGGRETRATVEQPEKRRVEWEEVGERMWRLRQAHQARFDITVLNL